MAIIDIRMSLTYTHEGAQAAVSCRRRTRRSGCCCCRSPWRAGTPRSWLGCSRKGFGYLLKDRVVNVSLLVDAVNRVASGQTILDPDVISFLLGRRTRRDQVADLSDRERDVLALVAQGRPNVNDRPRTRAHPQGTVPWPPNNPRALTPLAVDGARPRHLAHCAAAGIEAVNGVPGQAGTRAP